MFSYYLHKLETTSMSISFFYFGILYKHSASLVFCSTVGNIISYLHSYRVILMFIICYSYVYNKFPEWLLVDLAWDMVNTFVSRDIFFIPSKKCSLVMILIIILVWVVLVHSSGSHAYLSTLFFVFLVWYIFPVFILTIFLWILGELLSLFSKYQLVFLQFQFYFILTSM